MYYPNAARVQQFQANFLRKMAADKKQEENQTGFAPNPWLNPAVTPVLDPGNVGAELDRIKRQELIDAQNEIKNLKQIGPTIERGSAYDRYNNAVAALGGGHPSAQEYENQLFADKNAAARRERIKQVLLAYAPYVGGGLGLGALIGGFVGNRYNQTLAGSLVGGLGGAALAGAGKYAYDKYRAKSQQA